MTSSKNSWPLCGECIERIRSRSSETSYKVIAVVQVKNEGSPNQGHGRKTEKQTSILTERQDVE